MSERIIGLGVGELHDGAERSEVAGMSERGERIIGLGVAELHDGAERSEVAA